MKKPPSIEVHEYSTPTAANAECPYSIGIMNLTRDEARTLAALAQELDQRRWMTATQSAELYRDQRPMGITGPPPPQRNDWQEEAARQLRARVSQAQGQIDAQLMKEVERLIALEQLRTEPEPEPVTLRNRFSGLDITGGTPE